MNNSKDKQLLDNAKNLYQSMRITIDSRFQAGKRLASIDKFTFMTTIILSLALIAIPLLQFSNIKLYYNNNVLSTLQVFFAIAMLVYSVVISTAKYSMRSKEMMSCADSIKDLSRELKDIIALNEESSINDKDKITKELLKEFNLRYRECLKFSENHTDADYHLVKKILLLKDMEKKETSKTVTYSINKYIVHPILRLFFKIKSVRNYILPLILLFFVSITVLDILGITKIVKPFLMT